MNRYFVVAYFQNFFMACNYAGSLEAQAFACYDEQNDSMPHTLYRVNENTHMLEVWDSKWVTLCRVWFVVRHNPSFNHPETIISENGIFDTLAEAEAFIKENGGSWKLYSFKELQQKMIESADLEAQIKAEHAESEELPF